MPPFKPIRWLAHCPAILLPLIAALVLDRRAEGVSGWGLDAVGALIGRHWLWLAVALALGLWVGWYTATDRRLHTEPEEA